MKQTLTRKELLELIFKDGCEKWKNTIEEILQNNWNVLENIVIEKKYMDLAEKECSVNQLSFLSKLGIKIGNKEKIEELDYESSCNILRIKIRSSKDFIEDYQWWEHQLATIIRAANYIDNDNKEWKLDWSNYSQVKYRNWFQWASGGFRWDGVASHAGHSAGSAWLHFKNSKSAEIIAKIQIELYRKILG